MQESCKKLFSVRFLQEMNFLTESCKICIFCQDVAGFLQDLCFFQLGEALKLEIKFRMKSIFWGNFNSLIGFMIDQVYVRLYKKTLSQEHDAPEKF